MSTTLIWALLLMLLGVFLAVTEVFIPSAGVLGVLAIVSLVASVAMGFRESQTAGIALLCGVAIGLPAALGAAIKILPRTPFGRRIFLVGPTADELDPTTDADREMRALLGQVGRTVTQLRPAGVTEIDGRRVDTMSEGFVIDPGEVVRVVDVQARRVVVRPVGSDGAET